MPATTMEEADIMTALGTTRAYSAPLRGLVAHRYELGQPLAHGGMATVWRGWDRRLARPVAVKTLRDDESEYDAAYARLRREGFVTAAIAHPHVVEVHDIVEEANQLYLIMELVEGEDLKRRIQQQGVLDPLEAVEIARQICLGLHAAHARRVIHRDVKPHNILLGRGMHAKLADFGLALSPLETEPLAPTVVYGTPEYMAPEQAMGERVGAATDLYGLGLTLYEALCGDAPFRGPSAEETMKQQIAEPITPLHMMRPDTPKAIEAVVMRAVEKDPALRYVSARQMGEALSEAAQDAQRAKTVFGVKWPEAESTDVADKPSSAQMPSMFWIRLFWVVFMVNALAAMTLASVFLFHLSLL